MGMILLGVFMMVSYGYHPGVQKQHSLIMTLNGQRKVGGRMIWRKYGAENVN
ncbi:hypothetical protein [Paenibacillus sp. XY044]|uniref:hypothetical protein n=1 Tax=Paenibacillus sp. XY044 TaxID=2026089 RepID=UPI0015C67027|nr:hypothetical protein [Paenibacillus sp. XY044]